MIETNDKVMSGRDDDEVVSRCNPVCNYTITVIESGNVEANNYW